uniref:Uncharacterized protein n=1 Tax=Clastoptera arizonana TaxID=38151 RepID=A0A1B6C870_9HEMI
MNFIQFYCLANLIAASAVNIRANKDNGDFKVIIGQEFIDLKLFDSGLDDSVSESILAKFKAIDYFVKNNEKERDKLIGFDDYFIVDNAKFNHENEFRIYDNENIKDVRKHKLQRSYVDNYKTNHNITHYVENGTYDYDYENFKKEYYIMLPSEKENITKVIKPLNFSKFEEVYDEEKKKIKLNCTFIGKDNCGWRGIQCAWDDVKQSKNLDDYLKAGLRLSAILWFWFKIYVAVAVALWIFKGRFKI